MSHWGARRHSISIDRHFQRLIWKMPMYKFCSMERSVFYNYEHFFWPLQTHFPHFWFARIAHNFPSVYHCQSWRYQVSSGWCIGPWAFNLQRCTVLVYLVYLKGSFALIFLSTPEMCLMLTNSPSLDIKSVLLELHRTPSDCYLQLIFLPSITFMHLVPL